MTMTPLALVPMEAAPAAAAAAPAPAVAPTLSSAGVSALVPLTPITPLVPPAGPTPRAPSARTAPARTRGPWWLRRALRAWGRIARACRGPLRGRSGASRWVDIEAELDEEPKQEVHERRCGWFDSSQDLREGLQICEHGQDAAAASELPVAAWLQMQLSGWRPLLDRAAN